MWQIFTYQETKSELNCIRIWNSCNIVLFFAVKTLNTNVQVVISYAEKNDLKNWRGSTRAEYIFNKCGTNMLF